MEIYLEAALPNGEMADIGLYASPVVPRVDEKILLSLHGSSGAQYPSSILFRVIDVRYKANNHMQTEDWIRPFPRVQESFSVALEVSPYDKAAKEYLKRLAEKE